MEPSEFCLFLFCNTKISEISDMAKVQIKSEKLTPFGGIFSIMEQFDALLAQTIGTIPDDKELVVEMNEKEGGRHQSFVCGVTVSSPVVSPLDSISS